MGPVPGQAEGHSQADHGLTVTGPAPEAPEAHSEAIGEVGVQGHGHRGHGLHGGVAKVLGKDVRTRRGLVGLVDHGEQTRRGLVGLHVRLVRRRLLPLRLQIRPGRWLRVRVLRLRLRRRLVVL